jgi:hypothetical protein
MPPLVAIDEYESALRAIAVQAEIGLSAAPGQAEVALRAIAMLCEKARDTLAEAFFHSDVVFQASAADIEVPSRPRPKLADLLAEMPDGLLRVEGWDGL